MCTRSSIVVRRERTGLGRKRIPSTISRAGSDTLETGIEYFPFESGTAPAGSAGPAAWTASVAFEAATALPRLLRAVTLTRRRRPTSPAATTYLVELAPPIVAQLEPSGRPPSAPQRTHWYASVIGLVPLQAPPVAVKA
jgi:hypothetical protein